jgi:riboflavin kinase/FMN adenylyltransferase
MLNQGARPTVGDEGRTAEVHLFGVGADLYGRQVRLEWVARLRDIRRFETLEALRTQLEQDRQQAMTRLAET